MPCGHERTCGNVKNVANSGGCTMTKRSPDQNLCSKERSLSMPVLRNSDQRCIILSFVTLDLDTSKFLAPISLFVQGSEQRNHLVSNSHKNVDCLESLVPATIIFQVDLPKEQRVISHERPGSFESFTTPISSGANVSGKYRSRSKRSKSVKNSSSASLGGCIVSNNSSVPDCDNPNAVLSDVMINNIPKVDKPVKRSSRKKGKKKGKQCKRSRNKKVPAASETQPDESICDASVSETSASSDPASSPDRILQDLSEKVSSPGFSIQDVDKDYTEKIGSDYTTSSKAVVTCASYNDKINESEQIASLPWGLSGKNLGYNELDKDKCSNSLVTTPSSTKSFELNLSTYGENISSVHLKHNDACDISSSISFDQDSASVPESFSDKLKIDVSESRRDFERQSSVENHSGLNPLEDELVLYSVKRDTSLHGTTLDACDSEISIDCSINSSDWSRDVVDTDSSSERAQCSSQASSSNDFQPVIYGKRGRLCRKMSGKSNGLHRLGSANVHGRSGKDNNHSVWQKVQRNGTEGFISESKNCTPDSLHVDISSKETEIQDSSDKYVDLKQKGTGRSCSSSCSEEMASKTTQSSSRKFASSDSDSGDFVPKVIHRRLTCNSPENLKGNPSPVSNQEIHCSKGLQASKITVARPSKTRVKKKKDAEVSLQVGPQQHIGSELGPSCSFEFVSTVVEPADKADYCLSESKAQTKRVDAATPVGICSATCDVSRQSAGKEIDSLPMTSNLLDKKNINMHSTNCITDGEGSQLMNLETESSHSTSSRLNNISGAVLQKWVPVGIKESVSCNESQIDNETDTLLSRSIPERLNSNDPEAELMSSNSHHFLPFDIDGLPCSSPCSGDMDLVADENTSKLECHPCTLENISGILEEKGQPITGAENDLNIIMQAVDESYKSQITSDDIHLVTGSPLAEFEKLLHSASPLISQSNFIHSCKFCYRNNLIGDALCVHQIPMVSLGSLWQWYEKPGSYGLEVKVEDCYKSKRSYNGCFKYHAYFVPYLSAVQLFGQSRNIVDSTNNDSRRRVMENRQVCKASKSSSYLGSLPILSMLLPQQCKDADSCLSKLSSNIKDEVCKSSFGSNHWTDGELLFEYFESDQPQRRRPLFEKIIELAKGDTSGNGRFFGDPSLLESLSLHDLHPASWYSVAWYPIYRIPDGNFRAAFLTYHSLGHFVRRSSSSNVVGVTQIVSPVVGMQSYNAKGECWFQPRGGESTVVEADKNVYPDPSEVLKERLETLEQTASVMARASVLKGDLKSVNRQPDYEFFLSRKL